jgi:hypothetical protein
LTSRAVSPWESNKAEMGSSALAAVFNSSLQGATDADDDANRLARLP